MNSSTNKILFLVICILLPFGISGCTVKSSKQKAQIKQSQLYQDFQSDHRDVLYRSLTFTSKNGGPSLAGDTMEELINHRKQAEEWLLGLDSPYEVLTDYDEYVLRWNPVFRE